MDTALTTQDHGFVTVNQPSLFFDVNRFEAMWKIATVLAKSDMIPKQFMNSPANCIIALNLAERLRVDPFMMMQSMYVVHGRPGIEAKLTIALVEATGKYSPLKFKVEGKGKTDKGVTRPDSCTAYATELKSGEIIEGPTVTWEMAKAEGWTDPKGTQISKWQTMPDLMFRYRAATFFARVNCPGSTFGLRTLDELEDIEMIPAGSGSYTMPGNAPFTIAQPEENLSDKFTNFIPPGTDEDLLSAFLESVAKVSKTTVDEVKAEAVKDNDGFWKAFEKFKVKHQKKEEPKAPAPEVHEGRHECPLGGFVTPSFCKTCEHLEDKSGRCPAAPEE
jgi:hypothetical protein